MEKRSKNLYKKAMAYYEQGKINRALEVCELILAENLESAPILNFKGLLLYQKGDLNGATSTWNLNIKLNNDKFAKKYVDDSKNDIRRAQLFKEGESYLKQLKIDSALEKLKPCVESDFNAIKVNCALGIAYQKKGEFILAKHHIDKALKLDANYLAAKKVKDELIEIGMYDNEKRDTNSNKAISFLIGIVILIVKFMGSYVGLAKMNENKKALVLKQQRETEAQNKIDAWNEIEAKKQEEQLKAEEEKASESEEENTNEAENTEENSQVQKKTSIDKEKVNTFIDNNDLDNLYLELENVYSENLTAEDKTLYDKAAGILKESGTETFYLSGVEDFKEDKYDEALNQFNKAYTYCSGTYLEEHIIFYKAKTLLEQGNKKEALKAYEEYYNKYPNGNYTSGVLYQLALLTYETDISISKGYANELISKYPKSIYMNDRLQSILNS